MYLNLKNYLSKKCSFSEKDITYVISHFVEKKVKRNETLMDYRTICKQFYFIDKRAIRIYTINSDGKELSRFFAFENTFCTALPSFIDQTPSFVYLQTIEPSRLFVITIRDFYKHVVKYYDFERIYRKIHELSFINNQKRIYSFQGYTALEEVRLLIMMQPDFLLRVSNKLTASYLGMSSSTLSRTKQKL